MGFEASQEILESLEEKDTSEVPLWRRLIANENPTHLVARPPVVTILGPALANLVTGSFIIEQMFSFPGMGRAYVQAGAGIVADSDPESEHRECINKARAMLQAVRMAEGL